MSSAKPDTPLPRVPKMLRLAWLLFMQPLKLHDLFSAWGLKRDPSLWSLRSRLASGDEHVRQLLIRLGGVLVSFSLLGALSLSALLSLVVSVDWLRVAVGVALGVAGGVASGVAFGVAFGVALGVAFGVVVGVAGSVAVGVAFGVAVGVALGVASGVALGVAFGVEGGVAGGVALGVAFGVAFGVEGGVAVGVAVGVAFGAAFFRVPLFLVESLYTRALAQSEQQGPSCVRRLPHRHHDLIHFPLWGARRILVRFGRSQPTHARELIDEAAATIGQKKVARRALHELQACDLEDSARNDTWSRIVSLDGPFFPSVEQLSPNESLRAFVDSAKDIQSSLTGGSQHRRRNLLESARKRIDDLMLDYATKTSSDPHRARHLNRVAQVWAQAITTKLEMLAEEIARAPEVPAVFVIGSPFDPNKPEEVELFRIRRDLVEIIDRDLDDDRRGPLFLTGQRRMGKTSLLRMLPAHLGSSTIVSLDFQGLSGSGHGHAVHRWVVEKLNAELSASPGLELPSIESVTDAWGTAKTWLEQVDAILASANRRALIAIDEVERLQDGIDEGWASPTFLDFVRAAGDALHRIRLLLVSAHQLSSPRLGRKWADRLISAYPCHLGPLPLEEAARLLRKPVPYFPDEVFDDDAVEAILAQTGGHPYLIQVAGDQVVKRLNRDHRKAATPHDVTRALDGALNVARDNLFSDLWLDFDEADSTMLRALARGETIDTESSTFRRLRDQSFLRAREDGTATFVFPLFARWIREYKS